MSLFGHHHAEPTVLSRLGDVVLAVAHLPLAFWLTVIPIGGGLAIAYVTHRLNVGRDRTALERDEQRRRLDEERLTNRVHTDLALRLSRHRDALRGAARDGDLGALVAAHAALERRAAEPDVIDVLGSRYLPFMAVVQREEILLGRLTAPSGERHAPDAAEFARLEASFDPYLEMFAPQPMKTTLPSSRAR